MLGHQLDVTKSGELILPESVTVNSRVLQSLAVDTLLSGLTGAIFGFVCVLVGSALGAWYGYEILGGLTAWLLLGLGGCAYARYEYLRGEQAMAEFVLSSVQAGVLTGFITFVSTALQIIMLLPIAFLFGMLLPCLASLNPGKA